MKKNLLFIMPSLASGGGERSLTNLLSLIDYNRFHVDLFLLNQEGLFLNSIPEQVNLLPLPDNYQSFAVPMVQSMKALLFKGKLRLIYHRFMFSLINRVYKSESLREQYSWKHMAVFLDRLPQSYDAAIGFLEKASIYLCVDKVDARNKLGWIHTDYDKLGMDRRFDEPYFEQLRHLVTVSEECELVLKKNFPNCNDKISVIYNIISPSVIRQMADQEITEVYDRRENEIVIISIGRLHAHKNFELAIEACRILRDKGYPVQWNIIGEGEDEQALTELIQANGLQEHFRLLGPRSNPYPYVKQANLYVQTSRFEGKSIAIDEAKILNKPIVVTNFSTAKDQINHGVDGLIVEMNAEAIAAGIEELMLQPERRDSFARALSKCSLGTEEEIHKFYQLLE